MLMLCSNGLTSPAALYALLPYVQKNSTAAVVVTADPEYKEKNYHVPRSVQELEGLGFSVRTVDIDTDGCETLQSYDAVEFIGGNPFYLLHALLKRNGKDILLSIAKRKILIGWSAAAFVFGPTLELVNRYSPEMNTVGIRDLTALGLTDIQVLPHNSRFLTRFDGFEEICTSYEREKGIHVIRLNDGDGVVIDGKKTVVFRQDHPEQIR